MPSKQDNHQQGAVMALNGWSIEDIQTFSAKLKMPQDVTEQMIKGYIVTQPYAMTLNVFSMKGIQAFNMD